MNKLILNNEDYKVTREDLPYLVIYGDKSGGSHFTITLMVDLLKSGAKILFFTAFPMAKDNFLEQIGGQNIEVAFVNSLEDLENHKESEVIILDSGNESLFIDVVRLLPDINERVILVKNIEAFSARVFEACLSLNNIVLSGHLDTCVSKDKIMDKKYNSMVVFTKPEIALHVEVPELPKWSGYLSSTNQTGIIKVEMN